MWIQNLPNRIGSGVKKSKVHTPLLFACCLYVTNLASTETVGLEKVGLVLPWLVPEFAVLNIGY